MATGTTQSLQTIIPKSRVNIVTGPKTICHEFRVSRRVVRKVIRSQATEFRYQRSRQPLPRINPWRDQLEGVLLENEGKPARERLTLIRIFEELRAVGYEATKRGRTPGRFAFWGYRTNSVVTPRLPTGNRLWASLAMPLSHIGR